MQKIFVLNFIYTIWALHVWVDRWASSGFEYHMGAGSRSPDKYNKTSWHPMVPVVSQIVLYPFYFTVQLPTIQYQVSNFLYYILVKIACTN